jgi:hypothetical protein
LAYKILIGKSLSKNPDIKDQQKTKKGNYQKQNEIIIDCAYCLARHKYAATAAVGIKIGAQWMILKC